MGVSEWETDCEGGECDCDGDPFDCFERDDAAERRFADREGRAEGTPLRTLDPEELLAQLAAELGVKCDIIEDGGEEAEWPKPEPEEGEEAKTEVVIKAEVPEGVADGLKDGEVDVTVSKEGEIPEVSAEAVGESPEISEVSEKKGGEEAGESEEGEKMEESAGGRLKESDAESALDAFKARLDAELGESMAESADDSDAASGDGEEACATRAESLYEDAQEDADRALADFEAELAEELVESRAPFGQAEEKAPEAGDYFNAF